jgi:hypothetical protein
MPLVPQVSGEMTNMSVFYQDQIQSDPRTVLGHTQEIKGAYSHNM